MEPRRGPRSVVAPARAVRRAARVALLVGLALIPLACGSSLPSPSASGPAASGASASTPTPTATPTPESAVVPVVGFRLPWDGTDATEAAAVLAGSSDRYAALELVASDADAVLAAAGLVPPADVTRLVLAPDAATLRADLAAHADRLGLLRAGDVDASVRALRWGAAALFGVDRARTLAEWPLRVTGDPGDFDPGTTWTVVAGGDINLDGGVATAIKAHGVDFPFDGGTAEITGHTCCSWLGNPLPVAARTGGGGAIRALLSGADLAIANFENPAPDGFTFHDGGYVFSADPASIEGLRNAGIDWVSLANNHVLDAGQAGLIETLASLDRWGIAHGGAGSTLEAARAPSLLRVGGLTVAVLAYDTIRPAYWATATRGGSNAMSVQRVAEDIAAAREAGADVVIVMPHWGTEYSPKMNRTQQDLGPAAIEAGADVVLGSHTHWAGALAVVDGRPIVSSMGDFVFTITRSEMTQEGIIVELTFSGTRLVQLRLRPYLIADKAQPNLLDPAGSGSVVMDQVFRASPGLPW